jgi:hypothetical protein
VPHAPQFPLSVERSRQVPAQLVVPPPQVTAQRPIEQSWPAGQAVPQAPQCSLSAPRSRHAPMHSESGAAQESTQRPIAQIWPEGQALPQAPQWARSTLTSAHTASRPPSTPPGSPDAHSARPGPHSLWHCPSEHSRPAGQALPQAPQCCRSVRRVTQAPLQTCCPVGQENAQRPSVQTWSAGQALPQAPQCSRWLWVSTQRPPHATSGAAHCTSRVASMGATALSPPPIRALPSHPAQTATSSHPTSATKRRPLCTLMSGHRRRAHSH